MSLDFGLGPLDDLMRAQEDGAEVRVVKPGTNELLMTVVVCGPDSAQQKRTIERAAEEAVARGNVNPLTRDELVHNQCVFVARCCKSWSFANGRDVEFTEDNVVELLKRYPMIREQVDNAAGSRATFIKRS